MFALLLALGFLTQPPVNVAENGNFVIGTFLIREADTQTIINLLKRQYDCWNRYDLDGFEEPLWKSPFIISIDDENIVIGWDKSKEDLEKSFPTAAKSGKMIPESLNVNILSSDIAVSVETWRFQVQNGTFVGNTTSTWRKMSEGWRIVLEHTSSAKIPK
jgi:hypothetical protein